MFSSVIFSSSRITEGILPYWRLRTLLIMIFLLPQISASWIHNDTVVRNATTMRLIFSMTTNRSRVHRIHETINTLLNFEKGWAPDLIQVNVPFVYLRTNETFSGLDNIEILRHPLVKVHRCRDYGPITKLLGALETEKDPETVIVIVDDDYKYPFYLARTMRSLAFQEPDFSVSGHCGDVLLFMKEEEFFLPPYNKYSRNNKNNPCCCRFLEGFGSVALRVGWFNNASAPVNFSYYLDTALSHKKCFRTDDLVISNYLALLGIQGVLFDAKIYPLRQNADAYALSRQHYADTGKEEIGHPYYNCSLFLKSHGIGFLRMYPPAGTPLPPPELKEGELVRPGSSKTVYLVRNGTLHAFPDYHTFIVTGRDFSEVQVYPDKEFALMTVGPPLPNAR